MAPDSVRRSPELAAVIRRWMQALGDRDAEVLGALWSRTEHLYYVGSDEHELIKGRLVADGYGDYASALPDISIDASSIDAYEDGPFGWAVWIGPIHFNGQDRTVPWRFSFVLRLEAGIWKIVHAHSSRPRSNSEEVNIPADAFQRLAQAAEAEAETAALGVEGTATIMFTDVANSTSLAAFVGDRRWSDAIGRHLEAVAEIIAAHDGTLVKSLGDGTMSSFASARAALHAAVAVQRAMDEAQNAAAPDLQLQIRVGVHTGDVVRTDGDFFGSVVNKAARIAAIAEPGGILVSETTRAMAEGDPGLDLRRLRAVELRGLDGEHEVARLAWQPEA